MAFGLIALILAAIYRPLGDYMYRVYTTDKDLFFEKWIYRIIGVGFSKGQSWKAYFRGVLGFSVMSLLVLYLLQRVQSWLPFSLGFDNVPAPLAFNTAASFVTNTNWQSYSPDQTLGYSVQIAGLCVQNFVSAAVGIAVSIALVRGFMLRRSDTIGNFWVDLIRGTFRILMPLAIVMGTILIALGVAQNFSGFTTVATVAGGEQTIMGGPVASQEAIKELGTNGGGFFNANSSHPYENPNMWTNLIEILLMLAIPVALTRTFGRMIGNIRQGYALLGAMVVLFGISFFAVVSFESFVDDPLTSLTGGSMEGKEDRFGIVWSALFGTTSTSTSTGAVNSMHDSYTALGGMMYMFNMMLGEVSPGGVGAGLYGILVMAVVAVFIAGLMVGRTPEYLGKKIGPREMKMASLYFLVMPVTVVLFVALSFRHPGHPRRHVRGPEQQRKPWSVRSGLRVRVRRQQQRLRIRGPVRRHPVARHDDRPGHAHRTVPADHAGAKPGRLAGQAGCRAGDRRHDEDRQQAVRWPARFRHFHYFRADVLPDACSGTVGRRFGGITCLPRPQTTSSTTCVPATTHRCRRCWARVCRRRSGNSVPPRCGTTPSCSWYGWAPHS